MKAASKPVAKDPPGDAQKGKAANGGEMKPKEVVNGLSGATSEGTQGSESSTTEPMGEPSTEAAAELMREATSLLKSIRSLKAVRMKSVGEGNFGGPGEYATHGLRQAKPEEEPDLIATKVETGLWVNGALQALQASDLAEQGAGGANHTFGLAGGGRPQDHMAQGQHCDPSPNEGTIEMQLEGRLPGDVSLRGLGVVG